MQTPQAQAEPQTPNLQIATKFRPNRAGNLEFCHGTVPRSESAPGIYEYPELRNVLDALEKKFKPNKILIEETATGAALKHDRDLQSRSRIKLKPVEQDRKGRLYTQQAKFKQGLVQFPQAASFIQQVETELLSYPHGDTTDIVDSIALALQHGATGHDSSYSWV